MWQEMDWETTTKDLGYACKNEDALQEAEEYAAGGCLIRQYMGAGDLEKGAGAYFAGCRCR